MNNPITLEDYYRYWDEFYNAWCHNNMNIIKKLGWTEPDFLCGAKNNNTNCYLPEPWWGYSGIAEHLHSVIVNFNPGSAGPEQERNKFSYRLPYSRYVREQVLKFENGVKYPTILKTSKWHEDNRAKRIRDVLDEYIDLSAVKLKNHLSIELVPWHTTSSNEIVRYCAKNRTAIFDYCIKFAAEASTHIENAILKNVVLLRMSSSFFKQIMGGIGGLNYLLEEHAVYNSGTTSICNKSKTSGKKAQNEGSNLVVKSINEFDASLVSTEAYYCIFEFTTIPGVKFVCIWGPKSRNRFPNKDCLKEILKQIIIYKLINS